MSGREHCSAGRIATLAVQVPAAMKTMALADRASRAVTLVVEARHSRLPRGCSEVPAFRDRAGR
jgi:hypothetical protein